MDLEEHSTECCIFSRSSNQIISESATGSILYMSESAQELLQPESRSQQSQPNESNQPNESPVPNEVALKDGQSRNPGGSKSQLASSKEGLERSVTSASDIETPFLDMRELPLLRSREGSQKPELKYRATNNSKISDYFTPPSPAKIQPTEVTSPLDKDHSKWLYICMHKSIDRATNKEIDIWYLEDLRPLKQRYSSLIRDPISLEDLKKVSPAVPEFIIDGVQKLGDSLALRLDFEGRVTQMYPLTAFLGVNREVIVAQSILRYIHVQDQVVLNQALAECYKVGRCNFLVRWSPSHQGLDAKFDWVQVKATKDKNSIICCIQQLEEDIKPATILDQAWGSMIALPLSIPHLFRTDNQRELHAKNGKMYHILT